MRFDVRFKGIEYSRSLAESVEEKFDKLTKLEIRPSLVHITFSAQKHRKQADVYIKGFQKPFRARAMAESYGEALDSVIDKLWRQMAKEKSIIKHHKNFKRSGLGRLEVQLKMRDMLDDEAA